MIALQNDCTLKYEKDCLDLNRKGLIRQNRMKFLFWNLFLSAEDTNKLRAEFRLVDEFDKQYNNVKNFFPCLKFLSRQKSANKI